MLETAKCSIAINGFVPINFFKPKSSSLNIHELTAADRYNLDNFFNSLEFK